MGRDDSLSFCMELGGKHMPYILLLVLIAGICLLLFMLRLAFQVNIVEHELAIEGMKNGEELHIFFISDIHRRAIPEKMIHQLAGKVDAVIIGGDLTEKGVPLSRTANNLLQLSKLGTVFYVYGNNDREVGAESLRKILLEHEVHILTNDSFRLSDFTTSIRIVGINDGFNGNVDMNRAFSKVSDEDVVIFVSHAPQYFPGAKDKIHPHLLLAGHLHGGQIRLGPLGLYEKGSYRLKDDYVELISNGFGTTGIPLRLGAKPECHLITLK